MLPTIERDERRSTYSSATWKLPEPSAGRCPPSLLALELPRRLRRVEPFASCTATRVSPASTETSIRFLNQLTSQEHGPHPGRHQPVAGAPPLEVSRACT